VDVESEDAGNVEMCEECEWREQMTGSGAESIYGCSSVKCDHDTPNTTLVAGCSVSELRDIVRCNSPQCQFGGAMCALWMKQNDYSWECAAPTRADLAAAAIDLEAEYERLREACDTYHDTALALAGELDMALNDPAFVRVPRAVLEELRGTSDAAFYLLREYGGDHE